MGSKVAVPQPNRTNSAVALAMALAAFAAFAVGFVHPGALGFLDMPAATFAVLALIAAATIARTQLARIVRWRVTWAMGAFLGWALLSSMLSGRVFSAFFGSPANGWGWLSLVGAAVIVVAATARRRAVRTVLVAVAPWLALAQSAIVEWQVRSKIWEGGSFSNSTYLLLALGILLPLTAAASESAPAWQRRGREGVLLVSLWTVARSGSRAGFIAVAVWLAWALWTGAVSGELPKRARHIGLAVLGALVVPAGAFTYRTGGAGLSASIADRLTRLGVSWAAMLDRPLVGWGPDGYVNGAAAHVPRTLIQSVTSEFGQFGADPHNFVAWLLVSVGIVGTGLFGWLVFEVVRNWRMQAAAGVLDTSLVWAVGLYAFQVLFAPVALQTVGVMLLVLGASLAVQKGQADATGRKSLAVAGRVIQVVLAVCAVVSLWYSLTRVVLKPPAQEQNPQRVERLARFWSDPYLWYHADMAWGWTIKRNPALQTGRPDLVAIQRAAALEPGNPVYLTELARCKAYWGLPDAEVRAAFAKVYRVFPLSPDAHAAEAEYLLSRDDVKGAWARLSVVKGTRSVEVWRVLGLYYDKTGDPAKAAIYESRIAEELDRSR